ncbi:retron system putative HNH endonuclease [Melittangium boletus]|uniref:retron system putative HNH endonuclease n=1 Tax=Melittangium boletus TaxID=83453 RepID=UPI003DA55EB7
MKRLVRESLSASTQAFLDKRTRLVSSAADAQRLWKKQDNKAFEEIRSALKTMATGIERCMYCEDSAATDIEHFWPKSTYPARAFSWDNYLLACSDCNSNYKRAKFPLDDNGAPLLIDPTAEEPRDYLTLSVRTGKYQPRTRGGQESRKGKESIEVFGLGRDLLEKGRQDAWGKIPYFLMGYADVCSQAKWTHALEIQRILCRAPFASVFVQFVEIASGPLAKTYIDERCLSVLADYPDIVHWI